MKRLATLAVVIFALAFGATSVEASSDTTITTRSVTFELTSEACHNLPAGTTINGSGTEKAVTTTATSRLGVTTIVNATHTTGSATDLLGNVYRFNYANTFRISNSVAEPDTFSGLMTDTFSLVGRNRIRLSNGFVAELTTDPEFTDVTWNVKLAYGDPISFASGAIIQHCDPL